MALKPQSIASILKDTVLFIVGLPVLIVIAMVGGIIVPMVTGVLGLFGLLDREPPRDRKKLLAAH